MYQQVYDPVADSLGLTSLFAAIPLTLMFVMLGVFKRSPQLSALVSLAATVAVATLVYPMPFSAALNSGLFGVAFAILTIAWILVNAMWIYNMTVETGYFGVLRESFCRISDDLRIQAIIIAYCFGALIEALAGSGVPIAICSAMLVAIGFNPVKAAVVALVADTAPVAFGALAVPITTLNRMTDLPYNVLGAMVGRLCPIIALVVPFVLVLIVDSVKGVRATWPVALAAGLAFALGQFLVSNFVAVPLSDIVASLVSAATVVTLTRVWSPKSIMRGVGDSPKIEPRMGATLLAYAPYVIFSLAQVPTIASVLAHGAFAFQWPGLDLSQVDEAGQVRKINTILTVNYLSVAGTLLFISGILTMIALGVPAAAAVRCLARRSCRCAGPWPQSS
ncbi:MAG TPA: L-lactate permease [Roseiarcus sp.]|jgi:lactate permease|nr:L-lactate permease [Roseiarcus sp.]